MPILNPNSTNYVHPFEPNLSDLHVAMDYLSTGEPALRVISNFQGNIVVQGDINIDSNINVASMPPVEINSLPEVSVFTDSGNTLAIQGTVYQGTSPWVISGTVSVNQPVAVTDNNTTLSIDDGGGSITVDGTVTANVTFPTSQTISGNVGLLVGGQPLTTGNPIPVDITDTCLKVMNCDGTRLNTNANSIILVNELPVANNNPLPVTLGDDCISIQNCGEGSLSVVGIVKIETGLEGLPVSDSNPLIVTFPEGACIPVTNCGTDGVLSVSGNITVEGVAVTVENPFPVDLRNTCIGVQNCEGDILDVNITNTCLEIQNCGADGVLNVSGNITVEGVAVTVENPFPVDLRNTCIGVQNCEGTSLEVKLTDGVNDIGFVLNDNDGQTANTWSVPVKNFNMVWNGESWDRMPGNAVSGVLVNISNSCLSVANCAESVLNVAGDMNLLINGSEVTADNPVPVTFPDCISIQNCGESTLGINGTVGLQYDGQVVSDEHPLPVTGTFEISDGKVQAVLGGTNLDAFARLRVSNPFTLFDGALRYRDDPFKWSQSTSGGGSSISFNTDTSTITMNCLGAGTCVRESKRVFSYQPGKSLLTMATFVMMTPTVGIRQRVGFFGAQNGVYFEANDAVLYMVIRKYTGGIVDDNSEKVSQANWNGDRLNGTGPSGITLNVSKAQIWWCDIEWLGVGSVRCGFIIGGEFIVCHTFHHANLLALVYMTTATLPVRYELTVEEEGIASMQAICSTVISEGGYVNRSLPRAVGTSLTGKNLSDTVYRPLVCIRLKSTNLDAVVVPTKFEVYGLQQAAFAYRIILNPTLTNDSWNSAGTDSSVEYDIAATALAGGTVIDQGVFVGSNKGGSATITSTEVDFAQQLGRTLAGVSDIWCLAAMATSNNDDAIGVVTWQEHA